MWSNYSAILDKHDNHYTYVGIGMAIKNYRFKLLRYKVKITTKAYWE